MVLTFVGRQLDGVAIAGFSLDSAHSSIAMTLDVEIKSHKQLLLCVQEPHDIITEASRTGYHAAFGSEV